MPLEAILKAAPELAQIAERAEISSAWRKEQREKRELELGPARAAGAEAALAGVLENPYPSGTEVAYAWETTRRYTTIMMAATTVLKRFPERRDAINKVAQDLFMDRVDLEFYLKKKTE